MKTSLLIDQMRFIGKVRWSENEKSVTKVNIFFVFIEYEKPVLFIIEIAPKNSGVSFKPVFLNDKQM